MKKLLIMLFTLVMGISGVTAQNRQYHNNFKTNGFWDNWEVSVDAGVNTFFNLPNKDNGIKLNPQGFGKDFKFTFDVNVNKWITPVFGGRIGFNGLNFTNYFISNNDLLTNNEDGTKNEVDYWTIHADLLANLTNWICGYRYNRTYNLIGFIGVGYGNSTTNEMDSHNQEFIFPVGLINRFRLNDAWLINIELRDMIVRNNFDNSNAVKESDWSNLLSATVGVTYRFKTRNFERFDVSSYNKKISELETELDATKHDVVTLKDENRNLKDILSATPKVVRDTIIKEVVKETNNTNDVCVFFKSNSTKIAKRDMLSLDNLATYLKNNIDKKVVIYGYADKNTGTEDYNMIISERRVEAVKNVLIEKGVNENQLETKPMGCTEQPFEGSLSRVVIVK